MVKFISVTCGDLVIISLAVIVSVMVVEIGFFVLVRDVVDGSLVVVVSFFLHETPDEVEKQFVIGVPWFISLADIDGDVGVLAFVSVLVVVAGDSI